MFGDGSGPDLSKRDAAAHSGGPRVPGSAVLKPPRLAIWPTLPPTVYGRKPFDALPFPLEEPHHRVFSRARHGLWQGVRALGIPPGSVVLTPALHHGSEIEALERAGLVCRFYDVDADLQPAQDRLEELLGPEVRALYLIHYFGIPQRVDRWRAWCDEHGLLLFEDAAMSFLSTLDGRPIGSFGDLAIFCLYKTFPLPDGGAIVCSSSRVPRLRARRPLGLAPAVMRHGSWLAQRSRAFSTAHATLARNRDPEWGRNFGLGDPYTPASRVTTALIPRLVDANAAARRRSNYHVLLEELADRVQPIFPAIPEGASPTAFLIQLDPDQQPRVGRMLLEAGVKPANFWLVPHPSLPTDGFDRARSLRSSIVGLPVHQELRGVDLERILAAARIATRAT
jgi:dTDP-4-amino-4,6-dideoxygalactose transaminase